jgi:hypothetical protein
MEIPQPIIYESSSILKNANLLFTYSIIEFIIKAQKFTKKVWIKRLIYSKRADIINFRSKNGARRASNNRIS